ncbi:MAG: DUF948 domain-containing protein [Thermoleophilia bacterium]|nr:DUF948 domain-containing protein [Thermoleophilia bacterium]
MGWSDVASLALAIFLIAVGAGLFYLFVRLGELFGRVEQSIKEVTDETVPILTRVQVTVDEINAQLGHVDEILTSAVSATKSAEQAASTVSKTVTGPARALSGLSASAVEALRSFRARRASGTPSDGPVRHESPY